MGIPQRVKDAAVEADQQLQAMVNAPAPAEPAAPAPPPAAPAAVQPGDPAAIPPAPAPAPAPAPSAQPTTTEAELHRLQQQVLTEAGRNAARDAENAELRGRLAALQETLAAQQRATPAPAPAPAPSLITDEDRKDFGEDMIDFVQRMIRHTLGNTLTQIVGRITAMENTLRQTTQQASAAAKSTEQLAFEKYIGALDAAVPGWRQTNDEQGFVDWLKNRDTFSRKTRHELLAAAHAEADADTVAEFFRAYWKEKGTAPAPAPAPSTPPSAPATPPVDPATLVAPTASNAPPPAANPRGGKVWTQAEIEQVYDDRMKKRIDPVEFARLEKEIEAAVLEGRVQ